MRFDADSIPWEKAVEMFEAGGPDLIVRRRAMTLRWAVECIRDMPDEALELWLGIHEPCLTHIIARPVAIASQRGKRFCDQRLTVRR